MVEKSDGKIGTGTISIIASVLLFIPSLLSVISYIVTRSFEIEFVIALSISIGSVVLIILGIVGLIRFSDEDNRKVGKASVITLTVFSGAIFVYWIVILVRHGSYGSVFDPFLFSLIYFAISASLLIVFFIYSKMYPSVEQKSTLEDFKTYLNLK